MSRLIYMIAFVFTLITPAVVRAQYYSVNVDYQTIAAMSESFATEASMEALHNENLQNIYDSYKAAEVASAGIFASKYLDRKALTDLNLWNSEQENKYYTRIYNIVSQRIIPKLIEDAQLMVKDPATALYWGSYLVRTCNDVKSLCNQFESIVTNSTLSFKDIAFVQIADEFTQAFNLSALGGIDWKNFFDHIGDDMEGAFTTDNLKADLDNLIKRGVGLAGAGFNSNVNQLLQGTSFGGRFDEKIGSVITLADNAKDMYEQYKDLPADKVLTTFAGQDNINALFDLSNYNMTSWISDYESAAQGQYYTQRVYIYKVDQGSETLCNYIPPTDDNSILYGDHWYRIDTKDPNFWPSSQQREAALQNSESHAGWSRSRVQQLNNSNDGYNYTISYWQNAYILSRSKSGQYAKAYAFEINVTKSWYHKEEVYEEVFDSYSMDWNTFMAQMRVKLNQYNQNGEDTEITNATELDEYIKTHPEEEHATYYIGYDNKNYYQATDARKLKGATSATFTLTCHDGGELGKGTTQYKCSSCGSTVSEHTKQCSMKTSVTGESSIDTNELEAQLTQLQSEAASIQSRIDALNAENSELLRKMVNCTIIEQQQYRNQYNANKTKIDELNLQLQEVQKQISDLQSAIDEAKASESTQTDDYTRIPQLMRAMQNAYRINWTDAGSWTGFTFIRNGTIGSVKGTVTFKATVSIARKPKYFLGIKIHRAIVRIDWELTSSWADSSVAEILELNPDNSDEENARIVNQKMSELAQQHPGCDVSVELSKKPGSEVEDADGMHHLLWASDRLEIARAIEAKLARIYTDLVMINKFLHYKHSVIDWVKDLAPNLHADRDRKFSIAERSRRRWMHNSGSTHYEREEEDDNYDDINE
ncbi:MULTISPECIES: hypothetical protein [Bacteroides]|jgi:prefoldin subunit 5|nr:hypothetical protein [Bacteroides uniformis]